MRSRGGRARRRRVRRPRRRVVCPRSPATAEEDAVIKVSTAAEPVAGALVELLELCREEVAAERPHAVARELAVAGQAPEPGADYRGWSGV